MVTRNLRLKDNKEAVLLLGEQDVYLRHLEKQHGVEIFLRNDPAGEALRVSVRGNASRVAKALDRLGSKLEALRTGAQPAAEVGSPLSYPSAEPAPPEGAVYVTAFGKAIEPRGPRQQRYAEAILGGDMTIGIGPAGTGKTFLAVACALRALRNHDVARIVLTRPVVEAGEKLGFLPGDLYEKVHPYLKPLFDAFYACIGPDRFRMWRGDEIVEIVPLAYMRGRTLENAFIILDEAQNTTPEQMKMFLTRMGAGSRVVVTGDVTQIDLDKPQRSGLILAERILKGVPGISFVHFKEDDVVRHPLVKEIIRAFEQWEKTK